MSGIHDHPWEASSSDTSGTEDDIPDVKHPWDDSGSESSESAFDPSEDDLPDPAADALLASSEFVDVLTGLYTSSSLAGNVLTTLCYWAVKGGMKGAVEKFAMKPGSHTGHCTRKINRELGFSELKKRGYTLTCPGMRKHDAVRTTFPMEIVPTHEALWAEVAANPTMVEDLRARRSDFPPPTMSIQWCGGTLRKMSCRYHCIQMAYPTHKLMG